MPGVSTGRAGAVVAPIILSIVVGLYGVSYFAVTLSGAPISLGLPVAVRFLGGGLLLVGIAVGAWVFRHRRPEDMIVSTYITFAKMLGRSHIGEPAGRAEPLVVVGPQKYTRNPLYFSVVVIVLGWALFTASTPALVWAGVLYLWFQLALIPFEERELRVLFGEQYARDADEGPRLVPFTKRRGPDRTG